MDILNNHVINFAHDEIMKGVDQHNAVKSVDLSQSIICPRPQPNENILKHCFRPLSQVRGDKSLTRKEKRAIHFLKYKALGCLPPSKSAYTVTYLEPFEVTPIQEVAMYPPFQDRDLDEEMSSEESGSESDSDIEVDTRMFIKHPMYEEFKERMETVLSKYWYLKQRPMQGDYKLCYEHNGTYLDTEEISFHELEELVRYNGATGNFKWHILDQLPGGVKKKRKRNPRKKRKNTNTGMITSTQLGQINHAVPYMKPITTTIRYNASLISDGTGGLSARLSLRNPLAAFNGSGAYVNATEFAALYDEYKVKSLQFQFEPVGVVNKGPIVVAVDYDAPITAAAPNYANIVNYGGYRIFTSNTQFQISARVPILTSAYDSGQDPAQGLVIHQGGWIDAATPAAPGQMYFAGQNLGNSVTVGNFVVTMRIAWRRRR